MKRIAPLFLVIIGFLLTTARAESHDDTLAFYLSRSDLVVSGTISTEPLGITLADGVVDHICKFAITDVVQGDAKLKKQTVNVNIVRFQCKKDDEHPLIKKGANVILFLKKCPAGTTHRWESADVWFGIQPSNSMMVRMMKRLVKAKKTKQQNIYGPSVFPESSVVESFPSGGRSPGPAGLSLRLKSEKKIGGRAVPEPMPTRDYPMSPFHESEPSQFRSEMKKIVPSRAVPEPMPTTANPFGSPEPARAYPIAPSPFNEPKSHDPAPFKRAIRQSAEPRFKQPVTRTVTPKATSGSWEKPVPIEKKPMPIQEGAGPVVHRNAICEIKPTSQKLTNIRVINRSPLFDNAPFLQLRKGDQFVKAAWHYDVRCYSGYYSSYFLLSEGQYYPISGYKTGSKLFLSYGGSFASLLLFDWKNVTVANARMVKNLQHKYIDNEMSGKQYAAVLKMVQKTFPQTTCRIPRGHRHLQELSEKFVSAGKYSHMIFTGYAYEDAYANHIYKYTLTVGPYVFLETREKLIVGPRFVNSEEFLGRRPSKFPNGPHSYTPPPHIAKLRKQEYDHMVKFRKAVMKIIAPKSKPDSQGPRPVPFPVNKQPIKKQPVYKQLQFSERPTTPSEERAVFSQEDLDEKPGAIEEGAGPVVYRNAIWEIKPTSQKLTNIRVINRSPLFDNAPFLELRKGDQFVKATYRSDWYKGRAPRDYSDYYLLSDGKYYQISTYQKKGKHLLYSGQDALHFHWKKVTVANARIIRDLYFDDKKLTMEQCVAVSHAIWKTFPQHVCRYPKDDGFFKKQDLLEKPKPPAETTAEQTPEFLWQRMLLAASGKTDECPGAFTDEWPNESSEFDRGSPQGDLVSKGKHRHVVFSGLSLATEYREQDSLYKYTLTIGPNVFLETKEPLIVGPRFIDPKEFLGYQPTPPFVLNSGGGRPVPPPHIAKRLRQEYDHMMKFHKVIMKVVYPKGKPQISSHPPFPLPVKKQPIKKQPVQKQVPPRSVRPVPYNLPQKVNCAND